MMMGAFCFSRFSRTNRANHPSPPVKVFYSLSSPTYNPVPASSTPAATPSFASTSSFVAAIDPCLLPSHESKQWTAAESSQILLVAGQKPWPFVWTELGTALGRNAGSCEAQWKALVRWRKKGEAQTMGEGFAKAGKWRSED